jgi:MFS family permease
MNSQYEKCDMEKLCKDESKYNIQFDYKNSIDNYSLKYKLYCKRSKLCPFLNSSFFLGAVIGVTICANFPDRSGRLPILKVLMIINIIAQINYLFSINFYHILIIAFFSGFATYCNSVLSLMIVETMDPIWSGLTMSARSASYGLVGIILGFYFMIINNLVLLLLFNVIISILGFWLVMKYFVESPRWLNSQNRLDEAIDAMRKMAIINNSKEQFEEFLEINKEILQENKNELKPVNHEYDIVKIFLLKSQQYYIFNLIYIWFFITVCFYGIFTSLNMNKGNLFLNSIFTYTGEVISEMCSGVLANKFGRVRVTEILSYLGGFSFILSYFLDKDYELLKSVILFISSFGFAGSLNLLYIYTNELFPMSIKALTFGFMYFMSRMGGVTVPIFLATNYYPILLGALSISCGYLMGKLPETLGRKLLDDVPETIRRYSALSLAEIDPKDIAFLRNSFDKKGYERSMLIKEKLKMSFNKSNNNFFNLSNKY